MALKLTTSTSDKSGGCSCCDDHITLVGMVDHAVAILSAGYGNQTASLRFCEKCFHGLKLLVDVYDPPKIDRRLSCPYCATIVNQYKDKPMPAECDICKAQRPAWRSTHHPRFGVKGD